MLKRRDFVLLGGMAALGMPLALRGGCGGGKRGAMMNIEPFKPYVPQSMIDDLHERLARARFPDSLPGTGWSYGADSNYLRELRDHWLHRFDWRKCEQEMERFHHFRLVLPEIRIHFIH